MASASPLSSGTSADGITDPGSSDTIEMVSQQELNAWRRGFTPQAEIWNGRLAMLGVSIGLTVVLLGRWISQAHG